MKNLLLLCALLLALALPLRAAAGPPDIVVVRIEEYSNSVTVSITRGEGKSELVKFDRKSSDKELVKTSEGYYKLFQRLYQEGYTLQSTLASSVIDTTLLFVKQP